MDIVRCLPNRYCLASLLSLQEDLFFLCLYLPIFSFVSCSDLFYGVSSLASDFYFPVPLEVLPNALCLPELYNIHFNTLSLVCIEFTIPHQANSCVFAAIQFCGETGAHISVLCFTEKINFISMKAFK